MDKKTVISLIKDKIASVNYFYHDYDITVKEYVQNDTLLYIAMVIFHDTNLRYFQAFNESGSEVAYLQYSVDNDAKQFSQSRMPIDENSKYYYVSQSYTTPQYRNKGIHSLLFDLVCKDACYNKNQLILFVPNDRSDYLASPSYELQSHYRRLKCQIYSPYDAMIETHIGLRKIDNTDNIKLAPQPLKSLIKLTNDKFYKHQIEKTIKDKADIKEIEDEK